MLSFNLWFWFEISSCFLAHVLLSAAGGKGLQIMQQLQDFGNESVQLAALSDLNQVRLYFVCTSSMLDLLGLPSQWFGP